MEMTVPLHFADAAGKPTGLAVDLIKEAARRRGVQLEWIQATGFNRGADGSMGASRRHTGSAVERRL